MRHITDDERRQRLGRRHALAQDHRHSDPLSATTGMTVLHASEAASVHLALVARVHELDVASVDRALYDDRTLVKQLAMRRTLFVFPRELLPAAWSSAGARTAEFERRKISKDLVASGRTAEGDAWLANAREAVLEALSMGPLSARQLRAAVPLIETTVTLAPGTRWGGDLPVAPRILAWMGARGDLVRGRNDGGWWVSRPVWTRMDDWLDGPLDGPEGRLEEADGYRELIRRWLWTFGPGTETDIVWWLGATKAAVRRALGELAAVPVRLDSGASGWVLPDDLEPESAEESWAALLPSLDPTTMGWKEREFYVHPEDVPYLFDTAGNAGTTAWLDGRVVGCWIQDDRATVQVLLRSTVSSSGARLLDKEARRLTDWLDGRIISSVYMSRYRQGSWLP